MTRAPRRMSGTLPEQRPRLNVGSAFRYTSRVYAFGLAVRWAHLACSVLLVGASAILVLAGRSDRPTALHWEGRLLAWSRALTLGALASGLVQLALQTALLEGRAAAALEPSAAGREEGADARPYAVLAAHRFSGCALAAVLALVLSGATMAVTNVGTVAGLVGTRYGRLLLLKIALLVPVLTLAAVNRSVHLPRLSADGATVGRPAMRRLAR